MANTEKSPWADVLTPAPPMLAEPTPTRAVPAEVQPPALTAPIAAMPDFGPTTPLAHVAIAQKPPTPIEQQIHGDNQKLQKLQWEQSHPWGTEPTYDASGAVTDPGNHPGKLGKIAHIFSNIGNIAGNIFAPATMAMIPGTQMNRQMQEGQLAKRLNEEQQEESSIQHTGAETAKTAQETSEMPSESSARIALQNAQAYRAIHPLATSAFELWHQQNPTGTAPQYEQMLQKPLSDEQAASMNSVWDAMAKKNGLPVGQFKAGMPAADANALSASLNNVISRGQGALSLTIKQQQLNEKVPMLTPNGNGGFTLQYVQPGQTVTPGSMTPGGLNSNIAANRQDVRAHDKAYVQPAEAVEKSYNMMDHAYNEYKAAQAKGQDLPTGAQSMLALSTHLGTTFGNVHGARVTKDMIAEHLGARSISDDALVAVQKLTNGDRLSPAQWDAFHDLIKQSRNLSWQTAVKEAERKHIPVDFLPPDLQGTAGNAAGSGGGGTKEIHYKIVNGKLVAQ